MVKVFRIYLGNKSAKNTQNSKMLKMLANLGDDEMDLNWIWSDGI